MNVEIGREVLQAAALALSLLASLLASGHALLGKRDPRSAAAWITLCLLFPIVGVLLYLAIGNNRIRTRARQLHERPDETKARTPVVIPREDAERSIPPEYRNLAFLGRAVSENELSTGNCVEPLFNGEQAYPAMLAAIGRARRSVYLATYIFETRGIGREFIEALEQARQRGVEVRVLLDGFGEFYSLPRAGSVLRRTGIEVARFLPPRLLPPNFFVNLRNHRKILLIDGEEAYTGGMNLRTKHMADASGPARVIDIHFRVRGPVVEQVADVFRADWRFCTGETLPRVAASLCPNSEQTAECRVIVDGPDEDLDKMMWVLVGAISLARSSIKIMTPYFIPPRELTVALQTAALRGVEVSLILPARNNFRFMTWAAMHAMGHLLKTGVKVHFFEGPFVHSKLFLVDDYYAQIGSSNLDPRSLRLNFEIAVEVYDYGLGRRLAQHFAAGLAQSRALDIGEWRGRTLPRRLRDATFWLFSPYL